MDLTGRRFPAAEAEIGFVFEERLRNCADLVLERWTAGDRRQSFSDRRRPGNRRLNIGMFPKCSFRFRTCRSGR